MYHMNYELTARPLRRHCAIHAETFFRVMPRYKVRSEGDKVRLGDQVLLEAIKTPGQYLHVSHSAFPKGVHEAGFNEIDVSSDKMRSSWAVRAHTLRTHFRNANWLKVRALFKSV